MLNLSNPWSLPAPPTPEPFTTQTPTPYNTQTTVTPTNTIPSTPTTPRRTWRPTHRPVFWITHHAREPPHQTVNPDHPRKWSFRVRMSLSFRCRLSLPSITPPKWKWRSKQSPPIPIIPVTPNYDIAKTPLDHPAPPPAEDRPPSYHLPTYRPPRRDANRMFAKPTASSSTPSTPYTVDPTPLNPSRRTTTTTTKRKKTIGPPMPRPDTPAGQIAVSTPAWGGY